MAGARQHPELRGYRALRARGGRQRGSQDPPHRRRTTGAPRPPVARWHDLRNTPASRDLALSTNGTLLGNMRQELRNPRARTPECQPRLHGPETLRPHCEVRHVRPGLVRHHEGPRGRFLAHQDQHGRDTRVQRRRGGAVSRCLTREYPFIVRFIEYMPIGGDEARWERDKVFPCAEMQAASSRKRRNWMPWRLTPQPPAPERVVPPEGFHGAHRLHQPVSDEFCARCNRSASPPTESCADA